MSYLTILTIGLAAQLIMFSAIWCLQWKIGNAGVVDAFWGGTVAVGGVFYCWAVDAMVGRRWLIGALVTVWALRLCWHLSLRFLRSPEDERYAELKEQWGDRAQLRMFRFYQMQGLGAFLFSLAVLVAATNPAPWSIFDAIGVVVWAAAVVGELFSDYQLQRFKRDPKNKGEVCNQGLWRYSRHPNYFFEWLHWCCYVFFAVTTPYWCLSLIMPAAMYFFLTKVTGIPLTEKQAMISRGEKYSRYQQTTNAFFPWFPREIR